MDFFDVIIIGAGASGLTTAWALTQKNLKVCVFEQGKLLSNEDFIPISEGGEIQRYDDLSYDPNIRKNNFDYSINSNDSPIDIANFNGVGGSTILFSGQYPRFHQSDFKTYTTDKVGCDWPINFKSIEKYYDLNDQITGVSGLENDPKYPRSKNLMPPVPLGVMGYKVANAFNKLNWHWWPAYSALNTIKYRNRPADKFTRPSNIGDPYGVKGSSNHTYLPLALDKGLILKKKCIVTKLNLENKKIKSINFIDESENFCKASAKVFILCASGIGTPRLLLNSRSREYPNGLANSSNLVGKNLMLHPLGYIEGHYKDNLFSNVGPQGCCLLSQEFYETREEHHFKRGYTFQILRGPLPIEGCLSLTARKLVKFGPDFWQDFLKIYNHTAHMTVITEDFPDLQNKVSLNYKICDKYDQPGVSINYKLSENSKNMLSHGLNNGRKLLKVSGAYKTFAYGPVRGTGWHTLGTCKMGDNPKESVVNKDGQTHDISNLFIYDASIFPSSSGVNPASTIQALALFLSDKLVDNHSYLFNND